MVTGTPKVEMRRHVLVAPYEKPWAGWVGGPDHSNIPLSGRIVKGAEFLDAFPAHLRDRPVRELAGHHLYAGPFKRHFGHVMIDSIIRLWAFDPERHQTVVFAALDDTMPDWFFDIVALFGISRDRVMLIKQNTRVEKLDFAEPGSRFKVGPTPWYLEWLPRLQVEDRPGIGERLYFGRTHMIQRGTLMGESYFRDLLLDAGFVYVEPERHDIQSQVAMIRKAEQVIFAEGSSIYSIELLAAIGTHVFMIPRRNAINLFQPHVASRAKFGVIGDPRAVTREPNRRGLIKPGSPSFTSRPDLLHQGFVDAGILQGRFDAGAFHRAQEADYAAYLSPPRSKAGYAPAN